MKDNANNRKPFDLWKKNESDNFTRRLAFFCASRSGRFEDTLCNLVSSNDLEGLCNFSIDYRWDDDPRILAYARQTLAFYSKDADMTLCDKIKAFCFSFAKTELQCRDTNVRLHRLFHSGKMFHGPTDFFGLVSDKIDEILGDCPDISDLDIGFGPGQNVGLNNNNESTPRFKLDSTPTASESIVTHLKEVLLVDLPGYFNLHKKRIKVAKGRLGSVPKNAKTERSIIVEPILNGLYQKGIGSFIKERLLLFGCNLFDQTKNQRLACKGSVDDSIVTVDISNASNTVALLLVFHLMSEKWFNLLDYLRTSEVKYNDKTIKLEMFSSMGNGFTFELESLIFYAIALVVCQLEKADVSQVSVFGDDIVIPKQCYPKLLEALHLFGFEVNSEKSFSEGPFRESCGADYFLGYNIRPFYKKDRWTNARVVGLLNSDLQKFDLFRDLRVDLIQDVSKRFSFGPSGFGDGHIHFDVLHDPDCIKHFNRPVRTEKQRYKHGDLNGVCFRTVVKEPMKTGSKAPIGDALFPSYSIYRKPLLKQEADYDTLCFDIMGSTYIREVQSGPQRFVIDSNYSSLRESAKRDQKSASSVTDYDPFVIRGGFKSKVVDVYLFSGYPYT